MNDSSRLGRILGLDVGKKRIGSALSDELRIIASPFKSFEIKGSIDQSIKEILEISEQNKVTTIVIGMPYELSGEKGAQTLFTEKFIRKLIFHLDSEQPILAEKSLPINTPIVTARATIFLLDERFTSVQAEGYIKSKKLKNTSRREAKDNISASILVETYILNAV